MAILFLETNYLMGIATGRDPEAERLLDRPSPPGLAIPGICFMEAISALEAEQKRSDSFDAQLGTRIVQLRRDLTSHHASSLLVHLESAAIENQDLFNDVRDRLFGAIDRLSMVAEIIPTTPDILRDSLNVSHLGEPTDNLILHSILRHARSAPPGSKAFLSGNFRDFDTPEVRDALRDAGVDKFFRTAQNALGWLGTLPTS
jgi:hypothetical protein